MVKRLYLCRHGQTEFNIKGLAQGRCDSPLTELGVKQALNARDYFIKNKIEYSDVYCSPLGRAKATCKLITGKDGKCVDGLIEMYFGSLDGGDYHKCLEYHDDFTSIGGENREMVEDRVYSALSKIMEESTSNVVAVSHAVASRCFYYKIVGYDPSFKVPNCGICVYEYDGNKFKFIEMVDPNA